MPEKNRRGQINSFQPLKIIGFPFFTENLLVLALFTFIFTLAGLYASLPAGMGFRSATIWFVSLTLLFNYIFVIVDYTSRGLQKIPKLSGEHVFPTHDSRLYTITLLTILYASLLFGDWQQVSLEIRLLFSFFSYPLLFALLVVHSKLTTLLNPLLLARSLMIFSTAPQSILFYLLQLFTGMLLYYEVSSFGEVSALHLFWQVPLTLVLLFLTFRCMGVILNSQGPALGLPILQNAEISARALEEAASAELNDFIMTLHRWARVREYKQAFSLIDEYQREHGHGSDEALLGRLLDWDDGRLAAMLASQIAERIMREGETKRALSVFRTGFDASDRFVFSNGSTLLRFLDSAKDQPSRMRLFALLKHFETDYPGHPDISGTMLKLAKLSLTEFDEPETAQLALNTAQKVDTSITATEDFQSLKQILSDRL